MHARQAVPTDAAEVARLAALMYSSMGLATSPEWFAHAAREFARRLDAEGEGLVAFVVDRPDGERGIVSSGAGLIASRLPSPTNLAGRVGYIQWVATDAEFRGKGLARAVMVALLDWFERMQVPVVELHATPDGEPLYRSLGFGQEGGVALRRRAWDD